MKSIAKTATEGIKILWSESFLKEWRTWAAIEEELGKRHNHFSDAELVMALKRAKYLTRKGKPRNFAYIQKYPWSADESVRAQPESKKQTRRNKDEE